MDVFQIHKEVIGEYESFVESFINIKDGKIREKIESELEGGKLWPEPLIQFNPSYKSGESVNSLCKRGVLHTKMNEIFKGFNLYKHQVSALELGTQDNDFVVTSGTGSGKSLTYLGTIFNHVLNNPGEKGVKAIIIYPMNALINSQYNEIEKFEENYLRDSVDEFPITYEKYTGQEGDEVRSRIIEEQPDIILTNYMMMELIMTRLREKSLRESFQKTLKYLVFDELHTYRGRQGSDVAMQIRRIRSASKKNLICIGTSATMATSDTLLEQRLDVAKVARTVFGKKFEEHQIIDEEFELGFEKLNEAEKKSRLTEELESNFETKDGEEVLKQNALGAWLELEIGLQEKEGKFVRRKPQTLTSISEQLSSITGKDIALCSQKIKEFLKWAERINIQNTKSGIRRTYLPYKLHQFISQTGSVHVTLKPPQKRDPNSDILLDAGYYTVEDGESVPLFPVVFSRTSGHEFICVNLNEGERKLEPRDFNEHTTEEDIENNVSSGYILFDHDEPIWKDEYLAELPDSWKKKDGELNKKNAHKVPSPIWVDQNGYFSLNKQAGSFEAWFIPAPLPFDPTSGAFFHGSSSEYTKLTKLGSEARSTATSIISQSVIRTLKKANYGKGASKLLSFTDVRQDASLQSGHFNDFTKTIRLRSSVYKALENAENQKLTHSTIAQSVFNVLSLREEEFAVNPISEGGFKAVVNKNEEALKKKLLYDLLNDLKYGWRVTLPNLEQCGLLNFEYENLRDYSKQDEGWSEIPGLVDFTPDQRFEVAYQILDYFRKQYAISHDSLYNDAVEKNEREIRNRLNSDWGFDENERIERPNWLRIQTIDKKSAGIPTESAGYLSRLGRYLKGVSGLEDVIVSQDTYEDFISRFLKEFAGIYFAIEEIRDRGSGETVPVFQLNADTIVWKLGDGESVTLDPIYNRSFKNTDKNLNTYFRELYRTSSDNDLFFEGREHTGQIGNEDRQDREAKFKEGDINALFCSPTMELGIDIADLNVVHMRNVPPNPANYSQRSGRAGRSGQAALVFTYCANYSSHDRHFFNHSEDMVAGQVLPPRMDMQNEELVQSHLNAICLAEAGIQDLNESIANVLDLGDEINLPITEDVRMKFKLSQERILRVKHLFEKVISDIKLDLDWYSEEWLDQQIKNFYDRFDRALDRWRSLFKDAQKQRKVAQNILDNPTYKASSRERKIAEINERQARRQIALLKDDIKKQSLSEFYPYRYLASEGFLPGYNFTRLPIRAFMPSKHVSREGDYISRPKTIALREFGPGNFVYHNGSTYMVARMNMNDMDSRKTKVKIAKKSGYVLDGDQLEYELCPFTGDKLNDDNSREIIHNLVEMGEAQTFPRQRISCNEEERQSRGYDIQTYFKVSGDMERVKNIDLKGGESVLMTMRYIPAAQLYFVNRKWRTSNEKGFLINLTTGEWARGNKMEEASKNADSIDEYQKVELFVTDTADAIYLHPTSQLGIEYEGVVTLQYALKNAIEQEYQVEPNEIRVELMGDKESPNIFIYEGSEGSLGVLKSIAENPEQFRKVVGKAYEICHFNKAPEVEQELPQASYDDLLSYYNQYHHKVLDRQLIRSALEILEKAKPDIKQQGSNRGYKEHYEYLLERVDPNSKLEEDFVKYLGKEGLRLPDQAQYRHPELYVDADFYYEPKICVFIDGSVHDKTSVKKKDLEQRKRLRNAGYQVLVLRYDDDMDQFVKSRPDIFKKVNLD